MKEEKVYCDVCREPAHFSEPKNMQVVFTTEQNEGRAITPYFDNVKIDMCKGCYEKALSGVYIFATGAMGHNDYYFPHPKK